MKKIVILYGLCVVILLVLAVVYGPHSCEGGLTIYFNAGILFLIISILLPFVSSKSPTQRKTLLVFGLLALSVIIWLAGFALGNFRIMCRLF